MPPITRHQRLMDVPDWNDCAVLAIEINLLRAWKFGALSRRHYPTRGTPESVFHPPRRADPKTGRDVPPGFTTTARLGPWEPSPMSRLRILSWDAGLFKRTNIRAVTAITTICDAASAATGRRNSELPWRVPPPTIPMPDASFARVTNFCDAGHRHPGITRGEYARFASRDLVRPQAPATAVRKGRCTRDILKARAYDVPAGKGYEVAPALPGFHVYSHVFAVRAWRSRTRPAVNGSRLRTTVRFF